MRKILVVMSLALIYALSSTISYAQYITSVSAPTIIIDKLIGVPAATNKGGVDYVDNLGTADYKFKPGGEALFQLKVKNATNTTLKNVTIKDILPSYIEPIEGPGTYDINTRVITIGGGDFSENEEKIYVLKMKIASQKDLPPDKGLICVVNKADASNNNTSDGDSAQFCIEKEVMGATTVPSTGPEAGIVLLLGETGLLTAGIYLSTRVYKNAVAIGKK